MAKVIRAFEVFVENNTINLSAEEGEHLVIDFDQKTVYAPKEWKIIIEES